MLASHRTNILRCTMSLWKSPKPDRNSFLPCSGNVISSRVGLQTSPGIFLKWRWEPSVQTRRRSQIDCPWSPFVVCRNHKDTSEPQFGWPFSEHANKSVLYDFPLWPHYGILGFIIDVVMFGYCHPWYWGKLDT